MFKFTFILALLYSPLLFATELDLDADEVYIEQNKDVTAERNVDANYLNHNLKSDYLKYEKSKEFIRAKDNIIYTNKLTNERLFADEASTNSVFDEINAKNSLIALPGHHYFEAAELTRNKDKLTAFKASYTPCNICKKGKRIPAIWKISARKISYKETNENIYFTHAFLKIYNIPVLYSPFFFYPAPGAKKKSGFLTPSYESNSIFGDTIATPYFFNLAPNYDLTYTPTYYSKYENLHNDFEMRYMDKKTTADAKLSFTRENSNLKNALLAKNIRPEIGDDKKWLASLTSQTELPKQYSFETDLYSVSDKAYLERYEGKYEIYYNSTANINKINQDTSFYIDTARYSEFTSDDLDTNSTYELPSFNYSNSLNTKYDFNYDQNFQFYNITSPELTNRQNFSYIAFLNRQSILNNGLVLNYGIKPTLRAYNNDDASNQAIYGGGNIDLILNSEYPLFKKGKYNLYTVTPQLNFIASPKNSNTRKITNVSSATANLNYSNVTADNKISGTDLFEEGYRASYGIDKAIKNKYFDFNNFVGQAYFFSDQNLDRDSGIQKEFSDIVGNSKLTITDIYNINYNYKIRESDFNPYQNSLSLGINTKKFKSSIGYTKNKYHLVNSANRGRTDYLTFKANFIISDKINLEHTHNKDLLSKAIKSDAGSINSKTLLTIKGQCVDYYVEYTKNYLETSNIEQNYSLVFYFSFKGL